MAESKENRNLRFAMKAIGVLICGCLGLIAYDVYDNAQFSKHSIKTTGVVVDIMVSTSSGSSKNRVSHNYPVIKINDSLQNPYQFKSSYSMDEAKIGDSLPLRYLPNDIDNARIDTFSINWFLSIFVSIVIVVFSIFFIVIRAILKNDKKKDQYIATLSGKTQATIISVNPHENGWMVTLEGFIPEKNNELFVFQQFSMFDANNIIGKSFEVRYDPNDIEKSYLIDIVYSS